VNDKTEAKLGMGVSKSNVLGKRVGLSTLRKFRHVDESFDMLIKSSYVDKSLDIVIKVLIC
jgi:hypothetical protein